ncbi:MAG: hypothetical protein RIS45_848 [Planctomycetota bacterium]|jgi:DNA adenine methylase
MRPLVRYLGGKWRIAPWIIEKLPDHRVYVEPFGGAGSVLFRKKRSEVEIYNDLDDEIVNVLATLRIAPDELLRACRLTPYSRREWERAYLPAFEPIERARRAIFRSFAERAGDGFFRKGSFRNYHALNNVPAHSWANWPLEAELLADRIRGVIVENRPAYDVIMDYGDKPDALVYCDPPYLAETRGKKSGRTKPDHTYQREMTVADHAHLADTLRRIKGRAVVSGYPSAIYDKLYEGWQTFEREAQADGAAKRVEKLWIKPI